ncbi:MAG: lactonase family protein [Gemmataceae bacterium]|nr:lactonase family protein [Gemmataceae bacterium]
MRLFLFTAFLLAVAAVTAERSSAADKADKYWVYVGTYTGKDSKGIYRFDFDPATGKLTNKALAGEIVSPSFLAIHPNHKFLYSVNEVGTFNGKKAGAVSAFAIDPKTGDLKLLNQQSAVGTGPCHLVVDREGKNVLVANYGGGSVAALPIGADGKLAEASAFIQHKGGSVDKSRQSEPHAHSIYVDAANKFAFASDLGLDKVLVYKFDADKGTLTPNDPPAADVEPGSGPRHFAFHPDGKHAYGINEMKNTVTPFEYDASKGVLKPMKNVSTLPADFKGRSSTAEVLVHPSGKFLYGSNRGHDSIAVFTLDEKTGQPTFVGTQGKGIKEPRNFNIDPTGKFLLVGNQNGGNIAVFEIDQKTGELKPTDIVAEVPVPVCVKFMPAGK